jgi:hypothetical protein
MPPIATELMQYSELTRSANCGREQMQQGDPYSITSSARASRVGGTFMPSVVLGDAVPFVGW